MNAPTQPRAPRVLMLGAELGASASGGGLGTACAGLAGALVQAGCAVTFVAPGSVGVGSPPAGVELVHAGEFRRDAAPSGVDVAAGLPGLLRDALEQVADRAVPLSSYGSRARDGRDARVLPQALDVYARAVLQVALRGDFDLVYAHDWPTFPAAEAVKRVLGLPLVCHVHSTEVERTPGRPDARILRIESQGFSRADRVVAVGSRSAELLRQASSSSPER